MRRPFAILAAITAPIVAATGCGYPDFMFGPGGTGGAATSSGAATVGAASAGSTSTTAASASSGAGSGGSGGGLPPCSIGHLVISEVRSRGPGGASDEFVELFNPTEAPITLDGTWTLYVRTLDPSLTYGTHWTGKGLPIHPHGHFLIVGSAFGDGIPYDDKLAVGITDAASMRLQQSGADVDVICYYHANDLASAAPYLDPLAYTCEGIAVGNPHDDTDTAESDVDASMERKPGGLAGNCTDTGDNAGDFIAQDPSTPQSTKDPPTP